MQSEFQKRLVELLKGKNVSQVAKDVGMAKSLLNEWKTSKKGPSLASMKHVKALSEYFGIDFEELVLGQGPKEEMTLTTVTFVDNGNTYSVSITRLKD